MRLATDDVDVVITEIGGTVGDIESLPFLEAIRQFALDVGRENCLYIHLTLVPYLKAAAELKTKPTQHSVGALRQIGIQPDVLICRCEHPISSEDRDKIALFCNIERKAVIEERDKEFSIYEVPLSLVNNGLDEILVKRLGLKAGALDIDDWRELVDRVRNPEHEVTIAVVGKYMKHRDAYKSVYESLDHAGISHKARVVVRRVEAEEIGSGGAAAVLAGVDGVLVPGGFGMRGIEGKIEAIRYARTKGDPVLRHLPGDAVRRRRVRPQRPGPGGRQQHRVRRRDPAPGHLPDGGPVPRPPARRDDATGRLALRPRPRHPRPAAYGAGEIQERHRHRYEFNNAYRKRFEENGFRPDRRQPRRRSSWRSSSWPGHPWFLAVQFHPEFKSKPTKAHPLFRDFIGAALRRREAPRPEPASEPRRE